MKSEKSQSFHMKSRNVYSGLTHIFQLLEEYNLIAEGVHFSSYFKFLQFMQIFKLKLMVRDFFVSDVGRLLHLHRLTNNEIVYDDSITETSAQKVMGLVCNEWAQQILIHT